MQLCILGDLHLQFRRVIHTAVVWGGRSTSLGWQQSSNAWSRP